MALRRRAPTEAIRANETSKVQVTAALSGRWAGRLGLAALLAAGLCGLGAGGTQAAMLAGPGFSADVSATASPDHVPAQDFAPVQLVVDATITSDGSVRPQVRTVDLRLDPQFKVDTTGLPTCSPGDVRSLALPQARSKCGAALIGSGTATAGYLYPDQPPFYLHESILFFNAPATGAAAQMLMYHYIPKPIGPAATVSLVAGAPGFQFQFAGGVAATAAFHFRFGRTWSDHGRKRSYLSGRCASGGWSTRFTMAFQDGTTLAGAVPERCTKRG